jgi:hypothetical protein
MSIPVRSPVDALLVSQDLDPNNGQDMIEPRAHGAGSTLALVPVGFESDFQDLGIDVGKSKDNKRVARK